MADALTAEYVKNFLTPMFEDDLPAKRKLSLSMATAGAMKDAALSIHAQVEHLNEQHTTKQVDRLLSNVGIDPWALFSSWVPHCIAERTEAVVALDWTEFAKDDHATIAAYLVTPRGRPTALVWKTLRRSAMRGRRAGYEDEVLERLREVLPRHVKVTPRRARGLQGEAGDVPLRRACDRKTPRPLAVPPHLGAGYQALSDRPSPVGQSRAICTTLHQRANLRLKTSQ